MLQEILKAVRKDNSTIILREVAHGKPAEESSVYGGAHSAPRAVDGNLNTIMHTNLEQSPYWMVDLGKNYQIKRIEIFNVIDGAKSTEGKGTFVIETSKRLVSWNTILTASSIIECSRLCAKNGDCCSASYNEKSMLCYLNNDCPPKMENDTNSKTISRKPANCTINLKEVAYNKPAEQSSVYINETTASRAVDGNVNSIMHTKREQSPYWIVDLGQIYQIKRIEVFNRIHGTKATVERLRDLDIMIGPSHNEMHLCAHYVGPAQSGDHLLFTCGHVENARYVKLRLAGSNYLHVAEVKVYAVNDSCN